MFVELLLLLKLKLFTKGIQLRFQLVIIKFLEVNNNAANNGR